MNQSADSSQSIFAPKCAFRFGVALLVGIGLVVMLAMLDQQQRSRLESVSETTAVGDTNFFKPPADPKALPMKVASLNGRALVVATVEKVEVRDMRVRRVAVDASNGVAIYELSPAATDDDRRRTGNGVYLLKLAPDEYVRAQVAAP